jgi:hypothetical protein
MRRFTAQGEVPARLDAILYDDFSRLRAARRSEDARINDYVGSSKPIRYRTFVNPQDIEQILAPALDHFFNHQTHHRGQAHALISRILGNDRTPSFDLIIYQRETGEGGCGKSADALLDVTALEILVRGLWRSGFFLWCLFGRSSRLWLLGRAVDDLQPAVGKCVNAGPRSTQKSQNRPALTFVARADRYVARDARPLHRLAFRHAEPDTACDLRHCRLNFLLVGIGRRRSLSWRRLCGLCGRRTRQRALAIGAH